jgi:hypothetical protein
MASTEQDVKRALLVRSTHYKDIKPDELVSLADMARKHGLTAKELAGAFDKHMTVNRWARAPQAALPCPLPGVAYTPSPTRSYESTSVSAADVKAFTAGFAKQASKATPQPRIGNLFNRSSWEE